MGNPKLRLISSHYDAAGAWAREPNLPSVVELRRSARRHAMGHERRFDRAVVTVSKFALAFSAGYALAVLL